MFKRIMEPEPEKKPEQKQEPVRTLKSLPVEKLNQIVLDIVDQKIFVDRHIKGPSLENITQTFQFVFMPLVFADKDTLELCSREGGLFFEYYEEALPTGMNGYPCFMSMRILNKKDAEYVLKKCDELSAERKAMNKAVLGIGKEK